ncbi:tRNA (cytosine(38)-C(5))-methyltransferase [Aricia agestis]|uniref:tRNA (cytosine(38)-C(5))-methyltransferase n=1 Tax=Aricia agestis TaxID=91739 RepID=UPI001C203C10|nr:tRNA (cytosine(38)-C(5))-methyltransferase [Aricia agestis]
MTHRILELYSGIGGMHCAWLDSSLNGEVVAAIDINTIANCVYKHNFPQTTLITKNIQSLTVEAIEKLDVNTILMSPPCQPFTRNGKQMGESDPRTDSFLYIISILDQFVKLEYILMENVKGFETSSVRDLFIMKLQDCNFTFQEFLVCPSSVGVPNSRLRYYCIARRKPDWNFKRKDEIMTSLPNEYSEQFSIENIIMDASDAYLVPDKILKYIHAMDIIYKHSKRSCCFTKAYSHYAEGTGSIYTNSNPEDVKESLQEAKLYEPGSIEFLTPLKKHKFRYLTPMELVALMCFPNKFSFPDNITTKQCYKLLGNSVNVKVISELLKILFN